MSRYVVKVKLSIEEQPKYDTEIKTTTTDEFTLGDIGYRCLLRLLERGAGKGVDLYLEDRIISQFKHIVKDYEK